MAEVKKVSRAEAEKQLKGCAILAIAMTAFCAIAITLVAIFTRFILGILLSGWGS